MSVGSTVNIMGMRVIIAEEQRDLVWVVGNAPGISTRYLPRSWWKITKMPDDQAVINADD